MRRRVDRRWYVLEVEDIDLVLHQWERRGKCRMVDLWRPARVVRILRDGAWAEVLEELYPGYLLAKCPFGPVVIEDATGARVLRRGRSYCPLTEAEVERTNAEVRFERYHVEHCLSVGQSVEFRPDARSPFAGLEAVYMGHLLAEGYFARVAIWVMDVLKVKVVPYDHLRPCGTSDARGRRAQAGSARSPSHTAGRSTSSRLSRIQMAGD